MSDKLNIPSKFPELISKYKKKNHLNNIEMINRINKLIENEEDKILTKRDDYGNIIPSTAFTEYISFTKRRRPKKMAQRIAIIQLLNVSYIKTIFFNGKEVINYFDNLYDYVIDVLNRIYQNDNSFLNTALSLEI